MTIGDWKYYNRAAVPDVAPHKTPDLAPLRDGSLWKMPGRPLLARWTEHFDCAAETGWWYCVKDAPYRPEELKAKRRYEIVKGRRNFSVSVCDPLQLPDEIHRVAALAFSAYPAGCRPRLDKDVFIGELKDKFSGRREYLFFSARDRLDGALCGYAYLRVHEDYAEFNVLKTVPAHEKRGVNTALVDGVCRHFGSRLGPGFYISDGARNVLHQTRFQDYLEKYFGFRKARAELHVCYRKDVAAAVRLLYPLRALIGKCPGRLAARVAAVLKMEELARRSAPRRPIFFRRETP